MLKKALGRFRHVNCRIGSLEMVDDAGLVDDDVNCRIGSLENLCACTRKTVIVNCRIGSLENGV